MEATLESDIFQSLMRHIDSILPPQDVVSHSQQNGVCVPQRRFRARAGANAHDGGLMLFVRDDGTYLPLCAALRKDYVGLATRDAPALPINQAVTLRVEVNESSVCDDSRYLLVVQWPGYPPKAYQLGLHDWSRQPGWISLSKLSTEVSKRFERFVEVRPKPYYVELHVEPPQEMWAEDPAPEYDEWGVGLGGIQVEDLSLASLEQVSAGSWQAQLFYKPAS